MKCHPTFPLVSRTLLPGPAKERPGRSDALRSVRTAPTSRPPCSHGLLDSNPWHLPTIRTCRVDMRLGRRECVQVFAHPCAARCEDSSTLLDQRARLARVYVPCLP